MFQRFKEEIKPKKKFAPALLFSVFISSTRMHLHKMKFRKCDLNCCHWLDEWRSIVLPIKFIARSKIIKTSHKKKIDCLKRAHIPNRPINGNVVKKSAKFTVNFRTCYFMSMISWTLFFLALSPPNGHAVFLQMKCYVNKWDKQWKIVVHMARIRLRLCTTSTNKRFRLQRSSFTAQFFTVLNVCLCCAQF